VGGGETAPILKEAKDKGFERGRRGVSKKEKIKAGRERFLIGKGGWGSRLKRGETYRRRKKG